MIATRTLLAALTLASSALAVGCAAPTAGPVASGSAEALSTSELEGTYTEVGTNSVELTYFQYTFNKDSSFTATGGCRPTPPAQCFVTFAGGGTWHLTKDGANHKLTLEDNDGSKNSYYVTLAGNSLTMNATVADEADPLKTANFFNAGWTREIPIGGICQDDSGNSLGRGCEDSGNFGCGIDGTGDNVYTCVPLD